MTPGPLVAPGSRGANSGPGQAQALGWRWQEARGGRSVSEGEVERRRTSAAYVLLLLAISFASCAPRLPLNIFSAS